MKQATALELLKQGHHVFLTGQAGAGKTYLLNQYISYLHQHRIPVAITASTGIAATHMNGMTIHSWSGIGIKDDLNEKQLKTLKQKEALVERLKAACVLIIDEVSMLHARQLDLVDMVLQTIRQNPRPFGGVQVILSGDFFQLPPVGNPKETNKDKFAFMSKVWITLANLKTDGSPAMKVCYLSEQYRQTKETDHGLGLNDILNQIRNQAITNDAINALLATKNNQVALNRTRLYTHNANVDKINEQELAKLDGKAHEFVGVSLGEEGGLLDTLKKNVRAPEVLTLKKGAKVMFVKNNPLVDVYNGTLAEVVDFEKDDDGELLPLVKLNNQRTLLVSHETWSIDDDNGIAIVSFSQLPLCLAWAITVHKSQGMTLDAAEIDLSQTFELGQGYVALSRVRSLSGLKLLGLNQKSLLLDNFAQAANRRFLALSAECEAWFNALSDEQKQDKKQSFINKNANQNLKLPSLASSNISTNAPQNRSNSQTDNNQDDNNQAIITLVQQQKSLGDIAVAQKRSKNTTAEHIKSLVESNKLSLADIAYLIDNTTIKKVADAFALLEAKGLFEGGVRLQPISDELREQFDFATIRLALLFVNKDNHE